MHVIDGATTARLLPYPELIDALDDAFAKGEEAATAPPRLHYSVPELVSHSQPAQAVPAR